MVRTRQFDRGEEQPDRKEKPDSARPVGDEIRAPHERVPSEKLLRILQVITPSRIGGAERSTTSLCESLVKAGHTVTIACKRGHPLVEVMREAGLDARGIRLSGKGNLAAPLLLARLAREERVELINTQLSTAAVWGSVAGRLAGIPTVATVRALNARTAYLLAHRVIAVSQAVKDHLVAQGMPGGRIDVVYNGVDPGRYRLTLTREEAREQWGLERDTVVFAVIGHLSVKKGHAVFLEAAARLAAASGQQHLFAGEGSEEERLRKQARILQLENRVTFTGFLPDILPIYAAADVIVSSSIAGEGLPRALLEAGMLGRPVIGTRLSGTPEIVEEGVTGLIVPPGDAGALADAMLRLAGDPGMRRRMGTAAAERVSRLFTIPAMVEGTLAAYRRAIEAVVGRQ
jgi:glycosyltransferase involved in cell wall biosynthesis